MPAGSIIYHLDRTDPHEAARILGKKFALSGGVPNALLAFGTEAEVRAQCRELIENIGSDGGYIMDASAIMQNDATLANLKAMTDATLEYGAYRSPSSPSGKITARPEQTTAGLPAWVSGHRPQPGICLPFDEKLKDLAPICGDPAIVRRIWDENEGLAYLYIWHVLLSF